MQTCVSGLQRILAPCRAAAKHAEEGDCLCRQQQGTGSSTAGVQEQQPTCIIAFSRVRGIMHSSALSCTMGCMGNCSIAATTASTPLSLATRHWLACRTHHNIMLRPAASATSPEQDVAEHDCLAWCKSKPAGSSDPAPSYDALALQQMFADACRSVGPLPSPCQAAVTAESADIA